MADPTKPPTIDEIRARLDACNRSRAERAAEIRGCGVRPRGSMVGEMRDELRGDGYRADVAELLANAPTDVAWLLEQLDDAHGRDGKKGAHGGLSTLIGILPAQSKARPLSEIERSIAAQSMWSATEELTPGARERLRGLCREYLEVSDG